MKENLEVKCRQAVLKIAEQVRDINQKLTYFLENYREDYYKARNGLYQDRHY